MNEKQWSILATLAGVFLFAYFVNFTDSKIQNAIMEAFYMLQWYARYHTLACVVPAMFIAGGIATFLNKEAVLRPSWAKGQQGGSLFGGVGVGHGSGRLLVQCIADVCRHLSCGGWAGGRLLRFSIPARPSM